MCEGVDAGSPVDPTDVDGAAIELILDVTSKLGVLSDITCDCFSKI